MLTMPSDFFFSFPDLQDSDPSIYKLKSPETHISACLITDYFPDNIRISNKEKNESFQSSIIEVRNPESNKKEASYGGVHWFESDFDGYVNHSLHFTSKCPEDTEGKWGILSRVSSLYLRWVVTDEGAKLWDTVESEKEQSSVLW